MISPETRSKYSITLSIVFVFLLLYVYSIYHYFAFPDRTAIYNSDGTKIPEKYPPVLEMCPPYWSKLPTGECKKDFDNGLPSCDAREIHQHLLYTQDKPIVDLRHLSWLQRCKWAKKCGIKYDFNKPCIQSAFEGYEQF